MSIANAPTITPKSVAPAANLKPKGHGAYAILGIPLATSLIIAGHTLVGVCVAAASIAAFYAHEPLLIVLGHRGARAQRDTPAAKQWLRVWLGIAFVSGFAALAMGSANVRWSLLGCGVLATVSFAIAIAGKHRTLAGELWGVIGLTAPCVPILMAGEVVPTRAIEMWIAWTIGFGSTTMAVRAVIASQKRRSRKIHWSIILTLLLIAASLVRAGFGIAICTLPMVIMAWYLMFDPPHPKYLKPVGWTVVLGTTTTAIWMTVLALR